MSLERGGLTPLLFFTIPCPEHADRTGVNRGNRDAGVLEGGFRRAPCRSASADAKIPCAMKPSIACLRFLRFLLWAIESFRLSRNDSVGFGEHTRPRAFARRSATARRRVFRPTPPPVGGRLSQVIKRWSLRTVSCVPRGRGTPHARARALPISTASFRLSGMQLKELRNAVKPAQSA